MGKLSHADLVHLLLQLSAMLVMGRIFAEAARKIRQPAVIGEIIAGILLGPTVLGVLQPEWFEALFPPASGAGIVLTGFVQVAVVMLLFIAGLEVDLHIVWQQGRQAVTTSVFGLIIPFSIGFMFPFFFPEFFGISDTDARLTFALFMGTAMAITALPVIVRILMDLNLFQSRMGLLVVASAMVDDLVGWLIFSVILGLIGKGAVNRCRLTQHDYSDHRLCRLYAYCGPRPTQPTSFPGLIKNWHGLVACCRFSLALVLSCWSIYRIHRHSRDLWRIHNGRRTW